MISDQERTARYVEAVLGTKPKLEDAAYQPYSLQRQELVARVTGDLWKADGTRRSPEDVALISARTRHFTYKGWKTDGRVLVAAKTVGPMPDLNLLKKAAPKPKAVKATRQTDELDAVLKAAAEVKRLRSAEARLRKAIQAAVVSRPVADVAKAAGVSRQRIYQVVNA